MKDGIEPFWVTKGLIGHYLFGIVDENMKRRPTSAVMNGNFDQESITIQDGSSMGFNSCNPAEKHKLPNREIKKTIALKHRKRPLEHSERRLFPAIHFHDTCRVELSI